MKSYGVTIQMKPLQQYSHMVLFISYVALTFESAYGNPIMLPFKGNLFDRTFAPYYLFFRIIKKLKYYFFIIRSASFNFDSANKK